jgi:hypothetical protein
VHVGTRRAVRGVDRDRLDVVEERVEAGAAEDADLGARAHRRVAQALLAFVLVLSDFFVFESDDDEDDSPDFDVLDEFESEEPESDEDEPFDDSAFSLSLSREPLRDEPRLSVR